jgi:CO dehydrogenase maturation factor
MKIAFVGKGGSGKTTISALVGRYLAAQGFPVLALDADINQHLGRTLGMSASAASSLPPMGTEINKLKNYLRGSNSLIANDESMLKTTPPGQGSRLLKVHEGNSVYDYFSRITGGVRLMAVGPLSEEDLGIKCYHSKLGSVELLLNHLVDKEREYVIVDMTAGADAFASGLFTRFDITFLVVEPTVKSVSVYDHYKKYARHHDIAIKVIGNKIQDEEDKIFLRKAAGDDLTACFSFSPFVKILDRGHHLPLSKLETKNKKVLEKIVADIDSCEKNWAKFYRQAIEFHIKNAENWGNAATGRDATKQIDPDFDFTSAISALWR